MRNRKGTLSITLLTVVLLTLGIYIINSIFWTGYDNDGLTVKPAISSTLSLKDLALSESIALSSEDINKLSYLYVTKINDQGFFRIESLRSSIKNNKLGFNAIVRFHGIKFLLSMDGKLEYDGSYISYSPDYIRLGKLNIPKNFAYSQLKKYAAVDMEKGKIFIDKNKLPINIESLRIEDNLLKIKLVKQSLNNTNPMPSNEKSGINNNIGSSLGKPSAPTPKPSAQTPTAKDTKTTPAPINTSTDLLKKTNSDLKKAYSAAKTNNVKQVIQAVQSTVNKLIQNENYNYEKDAAAILSKYEKLTAAEKSDFKNVILSYVDLDALFKLASTFKLF